MRDVPFASAMETMDFKVNLDLEAEFINHLVKREALEYAIRDGVSQDVIYSPKYRSIYAFSQHYLKESKEAPTPAVILEEFNIEVEKPQTSIEWLSQKLRERYQQNKVQDLTYALAERVNDPGEALRYLEERLIEIQRNTMSTKDVWSVGDYDLFIEGLQDKILQGHYQGLSTGFEHVDNFTGGLKPGYLAFLAARPKRQKTFFILKSFIEQKRNGAKPILFTLENTPEELMLRISCMLSGYPWDLAQRGHIDKVGWQVIREAWEEFDSWGEHWIARPAIEERTVPSLMLKADKFGADSIIISQFTYLRSMNEAYNRPKHEKYAEIVVDLKAAATRPGSERPIYVEAQVNREGDSLEEFSDMSLSQLGLTDMIGQAADVVFALYQNKEMRAQGQTQFGIIEARNHDKKSWYVQSEFKETTYIEMVT